MSTSNENDLIPTSLSLKDTVASGSDQQKYYSQDEWGNGITSAAEWIMILLVIIWACLFCLRVAWARSGRWGVKFGTLVGPSPPPIRVQVGVNPLNGQPIYDLQQFYRHWCLNPRLQWVANCIQVLIFVFFILAICIDSWSTVDYTQSVYSYYRWYTIGYHWSAGVVSYSGQATVLGTRGTVNTKGESYSSLCSKFYTPADRDACGTLQATGAFIIIWSIIGGVFMLSLVFQMLRAVCQPQKTIWYTWQYQAAVFQSQQLAFMHVLWSFGGRMNLGQGFSGVSFATSWWIILACWILSLFMVVYYRAAIQYRINGEPAPPTEGGVFVANGVRIQSPSMVQQQQQSPPDVNMIQMSPSYPQPGQQLQPPSYQPRPYFPHQQQQPYHPHQQQDYDPQQAQQQQPRPYPQVRIPPQQPRGPIPYSNGPRPSQNLYAPSSNPNQFQPQQQPRAYQPQQQPQSRLYHQNPTLAAPPPQYSAAYSREGETEEGEIVEPNFSNIVGGSNFH